MITDVWCPPISLDVLVSDFRCSKVGIKDLHSRVTVDEQLIGKYKCALSHCTVPLHHVLALCYFVVFWIIVSTLYVYCLAHSINIGLLHTFTSVLVWIVSDWGEPVDYTLVLIQTHTSSNYYRSIHSSHLYCKWLSLLITTQLVTHTHNTLTRFSLVVHSFLSRSRCCSNHSPEQHS